MSTAQCQALILVKRMQARFQSTLAPFLRCLCAVHKLHNHTQWLYWNPIHYNMRLQIEASEWGQRMTISAGCQRLTEKRVC